MALPFPSTCRRLKTLLIFKDLGRHLIPRELGTVLLKGFDDFIAERLPDGWNHLQEHVGGNPVIFTLDAFYFKCLLSNFLKKIFNFRRREQWDLGDDAIHIHVAPVGVSQEVFNDSAAALIVQATDRNNAIEAARAQQSGIQLANVIGCANQQVLARPILQQGDLFQELIGNGFFDSGGVVATAGDLLKFIDKQYDLVNIARLFHQVFKVGAQTVFTIGH